MGEAWLEESSYYSGDNDEGIKKRKKASNRLCPYSKDQATNSARQTH